MRSFNFSHRQYRAYDVSITVEELFSRLILSFERSTVSFYSAEVTSRSFFIAVVSMLSLVWTFNTKCTTGIIMYILLSLN